MPVVPESFVMPPPLPEVALFSPIEISPTSLRQSEEFFRSMESRRNHSQEGIIRLTDMVVRMEARLDERDDNPRMPHNDVKLYVWQRDGCRCVYCTTDLYFRSMSPDHIIPYSKGGLTRANNLVSACRPCNIAKETMTPDEYLNQLRQPDGFAWRNTMFDLWVDRQNLKFGRD